MHQLRMTLGFSESNFAKVTSGQEIVHVRKNKLLDGVAKPGELKNNNVAM